MDDLNQQIDQVLEAVHAVYDQLMMDVVVELFSQSLQTGGKIYEAVMTDAINGAYAWYGMYTPKRYKRGETLAQRSNIIIECEITSVEGNTIEATGSVENVSPHIIYTKGFMMRNGEYRPGGDVLGFVEGRCYRDDVKIPTEVSDQCMDLALQIVCGG